MSSAKRLHYQDVPIIIDGKPKIIKSVTKHTTCDDVINKLPATGILLAVYQSVNGKEKELGGKTKLLKAMRSSGSSKKTTFIVKQSEGVTRRRLSLNIFGNRLSRKSMEPVSKDKLKQVSDLAFYVQYQKTKLQKVKNKEESHKCMQKVKSTSSVDSMEAFLAKTDHEKMNQFLDFCRGVTTSHLEGTPKVKLPEPNIPRARVSKSAIKDSLRTMKLGFKRTLTSKLSFVSKTSASTINSTDSGYQTQVSDMGAHSSDESRESKRQTLLDAGLNGAPLNSTPVTCSFKQDFGRSVLDGSLDATLTPPCLPAFDEEEGKSVLMRRFMADTTLCETNKTPEAKRTLNKTRNLFTSAPVLFATQEEKCRFYWDQNCDSDSESLFSDDASCSDTTELDLDEAFVEQCTEDFDNNSTVIVDFNEYPEPTPRKLRRESAVSNLNDFEICAKPFEDTCFDTEPEDNGFSYSFNCSFPEFSDSQEFSVDYSFSESESDYNGSSEENHFTGVTDADFSSFMKSTESLLLRDESRYITSCIEEKQSEIGSDEGLGSMDSDSFSEGHTFYV